MNKLATTTGAMREHSAISELNAMRELSAIETDQVSGGQSTESILDRCGRPVAHNG